jgi:hypothetical protein
MGVEIPRNHGGDPPEDEADTPSQEEGAMMDPLEAEFRSLEEGVRDMYATVFPYLDPKICESEEIELLGRIRWSLQGYRIRLWRYLRAAMKDEEGM